MLRFCSYAVQNASECECNYVLTRVVAVIVSSNTCSLYFEDKVLNFFRYFNIFQYISCRKLNAIKLK